MSLYCPSKSLFRSKRRTPKEGVKGETKDDKQNALTLVNKLSKELVLGLTDGCISCTDGVCKLRAGNKSFLEVNTDIEYITRHHNRMGQERRSSLTGGQQPYVTVVSCADSRVPPELLFNGGLGEIFVIRNAGNTFDTAMLATVQYGIVHLKTPVLCILGHQSCGAIKATMGAVFEDEKAAKENPNPKKISTG